MTAAARASTLRCRLVVLVLLAAGTTIGVRLVSLQVLAHEQLAAASRRQAEQSVEIPGPRGPIVDRRGELLALSLPVSVVAVEPFRLDHGALVALEQAAGRPGRLVGHGDARWRVLRRDCDGPCEQQIRTLIAEGVVPAEAVYWERGHSRSYPHGALAAQTIGFVTHDGRFASGVELAYDDLLRSAARRLVQTRDARLQPIESLAAAGQPTPSALMLTLDIRVQHALERALADALGDFGGSGAQAAVLDPRSGELLAAATLPDFDPNRYGEGPLDRHANAVITAPYEPGSVIKPLVAAALLEAEAVQPGDRVDCEDGSWHSGHRRIRDVARRGLLDLPGVLKVSSNIGIVKFARRLPGARLERQLRAFGLGRRTGIDLPAESPGRLRPAADWRPIDRDSVAFGYSLSATTLQIATAYAALARGGLRPRPRIARAWGSPDGTWHLAPARPAVRAISSAPADAVRGWLVEAVTSEDGTGGRAGLPGYAIAGKTGTAIKVIDGSYAAGRYRASFVGFAPAEDPVAVVAVTIDDPQRGPHGGTVAAPAFAAVMEEILRLQRVPSASDPPALIASAAGRERVRR